MFRKILLSVLGLLVLVLIITAFYLRPFFKMPPEGKDALDAKLKEYRLLVDATQNRPKEDAETFWALIKEVEPALSKLGTDTSSLSKILTTGNCPSYDIESIRKAEADIKAVTGLDAKLKESLDGGFVLYQDVSSYSVQMPNFKPMRQFAFAYLADAVLNAVEGRSDIAADRMTSVIGMSDALIQTPVLIYNMVGVTVASVDDFVLVSLLPKLSTTDLQAIRKKIADSPDLIKHFLDTMKVESVSIADALNQATEVYKQKPNSGYMPLLKRIGYLDRERYLYISIASRLIDGYTTWHKNGAKEKIALMDAMKSEARYSIIMGDMFPNFDSLLGKVWTAGMQRKAVIDAIDSELSLRESGMRTKLELPYDENRVIVIDKDSACIVMKNK